MKYNAHIYLRRFAFVLISFFANEMLKNLTDMVSHHYVFIRCGDILSCKQKVTG